METTVDLPNPAVEVENPLINLFYREPTLEGLLHIEDVRCLPSYQDALFVLSEATQLSFWAINKLAGFKDNGLLSRQAYETGYYQAQSYPKMNSNAFLKLSRLKPEARRIPILFYDREGNLTLLRGRIKTEVDRTMEYLSQSEDTNSVRYIDAVLSKKGINLSFALNNRMVRAVNLIRSNGLTPVYLTKPLDVSELQQSYEMLEK